MKKTNFKEIVAYIQKVAVSLPGTAPTLVSGKTPIPGRATSSIKRSATIKEMQRAIQAFSLQAVSYKKDTRNPNMVSQEDRRKDFNDFLAEQYSATAKVHGEEWSPSEKATKKDQKQPTEIIELDNVINNLRRIGPGQKEIMSDGVWDFRTNNAVKNVYSFAEALIKSSQDFESNLQGFNKFDLKRMYTLIPKKSLNKVSVKELEKRAELLTPLVEKLTEFYKEYSRLILNHPQYVQYINKNTPLFRVHQAGADAGDIPQDLKPYESKLNELELKNVPVPTPQGTIVTISNFPLSYLKDMNSVYSLMMSKEVGFTREDIGNPDRVALVLKTISDYVNALKVTPTQQG